MNLILFQAFHLPKDIVMQCPKCGKICSQGPVIVISGENGRITGHVPEKVTCCGKTASGPKTFAKIEDAIVFIKGIEALEGQEFMIAPVENLVDVLELAGTNLGDAQIAYTTLLLALGSSGASQN